MNLQNFSYQDHFPSENNDLFPEGKREEIKPKVAWTVYKKMRVHLIQSKLSLTLSFVGTSLFKIFGISVLLPTIYIS